MQESQHRGTEGTPGNMTHGSRPCGSTRQWDVLFFAPKIRLPRLLCRIGTYMTIFALHWPAIMAEARVRAGRASVLPRDAAIHKNGWRSVLSGSVVLQFPEKSDIQQIVRRSCRRIIRNALKKARKEASLSNPAKFLPLGYARIGVYKTDFRKRRLNGYGLGPELVCTIQIRKIRRIQAPDIYQSTIETQGRYRIAWNRAWLDSRTEGDNC